MTLGDSEYKRALARWKQLKLAGKLSVEQEAEMRSLDRQLSRAEYAGPSVIARIADDYAEALLHNAGNGGSGVEW